MVDPTYLRPGKARAVLVQYVLTPFEYATFAVVLTA